MLVHSGPLPNFLSLMSNNLLRLGPELQASILSALYGEFNLEDCGDEQNIRIVNIRIVNVTEVSTPVNSFVHYFFVHIRLMYHLTLSP